MVLCEKKKCTGCGACYQSCPKSCISMIADRAGFLYPQINENNCIGCGKCVEVCPESKNLFHVDTSIAYAAIHKNKTTVKKSTSGGAFSALAEYVLREDGVVYGCAYTDDMKVVHIRAETLEDLDKLRGSKYVQSNTLDTFRDAKRDLEKGRLVLYSGTPCQIAGLYAYLDDNPDNLITVDLVCHGVPSPRSFEAYLSWLEKKEKAKVVAFDFRDKRNHGWSCAGTYSCKKQPNIKSTRKNLYYYDSYYYAYFLWGDSYRESCYECRYANTKRVADITLGDLWGAEGMDLSIPVRDGCSIVIANSQKAMDLIKEFDLNACEISLDLAVKYNKQLQHSAEKSTKRDCLIEELSTMEGEKLYDTFRKTYKRKILAGRVKYLIPERVKYLLKKIRYRK